MGGVAKNGAGAELLHPWGSETDYREAAAERVRWEMVLPLTGGSHEGSRFHIRQDVYKQNIEHGRAVHCNATTSGPLRGGDSARRGEGNNEVVGIEGTRLERTRNRSPNRRQTKKGRQRGKQKAGKADRVSRNGAERVQKNGKKCKLVNVLHKDRV